MRKKTKLSEGSVPANVISLIQRVAARSVGKNKLALEKLAKAVEANRDVEDEMAPVLDEFIAASIK